MASEDDNGDGNLNCPRVAGMEMNSGGGPMFKSSNGSDHFFGSGWDPLVSLSQGQSFGVGSTSMVNHTSEFSGNSGYSVGLENQVILHYQADHSGLAEMMPKLPCFGSGSFSEMVNSFVGLTQCGQITNGTTRSHEDCGGTEEGASPDRRLKKRASHSPFKPDKNAQGEPQKDLSGDSSENGEKKDDKKQKIEHSINPNLRGKQMGKQATENSDSGGAPKENYIHVRAKRGQATNSHSLAERVRRERISERMRLLQELVPGCNKITGKAVMLDEIINYVQSLQQQVEFLSMKLATVNPELNIDIERILSKDILQSRGSNPNTALLGFGPGLNSSHPYPQGGLPGIPAATPSFHPMHPQPVWDHELQNLLQMGFDSNTAINNLGLHGRSKLDL